MFNVTVKTELPYRGAYYLKVLRASQHSSLTIGLQLAEQITQIFQRGTGRGWRVMWWRKDSYTPVSKPGEAPFVKSGRLLSSISVNADWIASAISVGGSPLVASDLVGKPDNIPSCATVIVGSNAPYAGDLEWGTSKMSPRPWLEPSYRTSLPNMFSRFTSAMKSLLS